MSQWICSLSYIWMGKCLLTLPSECSLLVPGPNEELLFLVAPVSAKRNSTKRPLKWWSTAFSGVLGGSGALENTRSPHPHLLWKVLFLKLYSDLYQYAEETSFLQKGCSSSHSCEEGCEGEVGTRYNIGKNVLSTLDKNV